MTTIVTTTGTGTPIPHPDLQMQTSVFDLSAIFLTHYHSDHLVGLTDLVLTHWVRRSEFDRVLVRDQ